MKTGKWNGDGVGRKPMDELMEEVLCECFTCSVATCGCSTGQGRPRTLSQSQKVLSDSGALTKEGDLSMQGKTWHLLGKGQFHVKFPQ